ncbi:MAG TPA: helix-turn-helix domain-containing protein [Microbacteriaceae bacterium]|jgi:DNA-binding transcriptional ArsR family regulator|nr:helix-turn-helix domain-containing protein [Microbacteriaceae bacterium]HQZ46979.1 helix-turn-helix domain-containing protein [Microbacteriaceae bacterium]HRA08118.1 helix-turn-helix domain-containing protein [Microbacteriaceae bacterium]
MDDDSMLGNAEVAREMRVLDAGALRALAHPLRVEIYDILSQYGPQTASSLAARLGESSGSTSYHLRALAKHDLIREAEGRGSGRERWWERPPGSVTFANPEVLQTPSGRAASQIVMTEYFRRRHEQLMHYIDESFAEGSSEWVEGSLLSTATARLTEAQAAALGEKIQALIDGAVEQYRDQQGEGVRPVTLRADIFPLPTEGEAS